MKSHGCRSFSFSFFFCFFCLNKNCCGNYAKGDCPPSKPNTENRDAVEASKKKTTTTYTHCERERLIHKKCIRNITIKTKNNPSRRKANKRQGKALILHNERKNDNENVNSNNGRKLRSGFSLRTLTLTLRLALLCNRQKSQIKRREQTKKKNNRKTNPSFIVVRFPLFSWYFHRSSSPYSLLFCVHLSALAYSLSVALLNAYEQQQQQKN